MKIKKFMVMRKSDVSLIEHKTKGMKFGNYNKLNNKGVIPENTLIESKDIILGKVIPIKENRNDHTKIIKYQDQSKAYRTNEECYIDKNYINCNGDGYTFAKVRIFGHFENLLLGINLVVVMVKKVPSAI